MNSAIVLDVLKKVEIEPAIQRCVDRIRSRDEEQGLTIRCGPHDRFRCKIAARTRSILDEEGLTEPLRQPLAHEPSEGVGRAAGGKADDDAHRTRRIGLCPRPSRYGKEGGCTRSPLQQSATGKSDHVSAPRYSGVHRAQCSSVTRIGASTEMWGRVEPRQGRSGIAKTQSGLQG